ncbi:hypothetical protein [Oleispirillum naphthae]|uniref:hypothetical protein n=1 Tax=Oleispirillum naphthae TaxID=2838853 RepID=UPI00308259A1
MKTRKIIEVLDGLLGGERTKRTRRERAVQDLLEKLADKEEKILERLAGPLDADEIAHLNLKLQVNRAHQDKARAALDSWARTGETPPPEAG